MSISLLDRSQLYIWSMKINYAGGHYLGWVYNNELLFLSPSSSLHKLHMKACIMSITNPLLSPRSVGLLVVVSVHDLFPPYLERDSRHLAMACQVPSICPSRASTFSDPGDWSDQRHRYELPCSLASGWSLTWRGPSQRPHGCGEVWVL